MARIDTKTKETMPAKMQLGEMGFASVSSRPNTSCPENSVDLGCVHTITRVGSHGFSPKQFLEQTRLSGADYEKP